MVEAAETVMADDTQQIDYGALSKDATFRAMRTEQQRAYLSAVDKDFAGLDPESQKGYIAHITGTNLASPMAQALKTVPQSQIELRQDLNLPATASMKEVGGEYDTTNAKFI